MELRRFRKVEPATPWNPPAGTCRYRASMPSRDLVPPVLGSGPPSSWGWWDLTILGSSPLVGFRAFVALQDSDGILSRRCDRIRRSTRVARHPACAEGLSGSDIVIPEVGAPDGRRPLSGMDAVQPRRVRRTRLPRYGLRPQRRAGLGTRKPRSADVRWYVEHLSEMASSNLPGNKAAMVQRRLVARLIKVDGISLRRRCDDEMRSLSGRTGAPGAVYIHPDRTHHKKVYPAPLADVVAPAGASNRRQSVVIPKNTRARSCDRALSYSAGKGLGSLA